MLAILGEAFGVDVAAFNRRRHDSPLRAVAARFLIRYAGLSQRGVAVLVDMGSGAAVCNQLNRLADKLAEDRRLRRLVNKAEEQIEQRWRKRSARQAPALAAKHLIRDATTRHR